MNVLSKLQGVSHFFMDVDGVLTNGEVMLMNDGEMVRTMHTRDGYAMQLAIKKGYSISVISGSKSDAVLQRLKRLGIDDVHMGVEDKAALIQNLFRKKNTDPAQTLFIGDDVPDAEAMRLCAVACCPADAVVEIKQISHYISPTSGGAGCVRDVIEKVMRLRGDWQHVITAVST